MSRDPTVFILQSYLWLPHQEATSLLGRIVKNFRSPTDNFAPDDALRYNERKLVENEFHDFRVDAAASRSRAAAAQLKNIAGFNWIGKVDDRVSFNGKRISYKRIQQHDLFFDGLKSDEAVRTRVPGWLGSFGSQVCIILGVFMCEDMTVSDSGHTASQVSGDLTVPAGSVATAAASGIPGSVTTGNVQVNLSRDDNVAGGFSASGKSGYVFGLELKLVSRARFRPKELKLRDKAPPVAGLDPKTRRIEAATYSETIEEEGEEDVDGSESSFDLAVADIDDARAEEMYNRAPSPSPSS